MRSLLIALLLLPSLAAAQSFDCKLAKTPREKAVCADTRLSALDSQIAANYKALRAQLSPASAALVQSDQREWLTWIDLICPPNGKGAAANQTQCLQMHYFTRAQDFTKTAHLGDTIIFPRAHFIFKRGGPASGNTSSIDPGFGFGSLRWPQIDIKPDKPNAAQSTFNNTARTRAGQLAVGFSNNKTATFDNAVDASGSIDAYFTLDAVNNRLIDVTFTDGAYPWGAAHPTANRTSFLWWLDQNRELTRNDIFWSDSGWQQKIVPLAIASLQSNSNIKNMLWKGADLNKAVQSAVLEPANWTPTSAGLTITFGQYAVGPYVIGMPEAHLTWTQLKPYLAHGFQPSTLPAPLAKSNP